jgi:hypothetical protein
MKIEAKHSQAVAKNKKKGREAWILGFLFCFRVFLGGLKKRLT